MVPVVVPVVREAALVVVPVVVPLVMHPVVAVIAIYPVVAAMVGAPPLILPPVALFVLPSRLGL